MNNRKLIEERYKEAVKGLKEEWFYNSSSEWYNYIGGLPINLKVTYLIVILDSQVFNGGFHQYFTNGYGQFAKETIEALTYINANDKAELLSQALSLVNNENMSDIVFRQELLKKKIVPLFLNDSLVKPLDELDEKYYDGEENIEQLLNVFLSR